MTQMQSMNNNLFLVCNVDSQERNNGNNVHDAFTAFYPVTEKNVEIAQKTNEAENKDDCVVFSKVNIKPYSHQDHRGESNKNSNKELAYKLTGAERTEEDTPNK